MSGCDFIDVSTNPGRIVIVLIDCLTDFTTDSGVFELRVIEGLVDGFTLPFKLEILAGTCTGRVPLECLFINSSWRMWWPLFCAASCWKKSILLQPVDIMNLLFSFKLFSHLNW